MSISLKDKIVLITGASSGIGKAAAEQYAAQGARLILTARRLDRIEQLASELRESAGVDVLALPLDVRDRQQIDTLIADLPAAWQEIDVLVNNAGLARESNAIQDGDPADWDLMIDTNVKGLLYLTHAVLPTMLERNSGHIVNIGSIAGHECYPGGNIYSATKHFVKAISKTLRIDLLGTAIRVSEIDPGAVRTEFCAVRWSDAERADKFYDQFQTLTADDIADAIVYCTTRPLHVDVAEIVIMPISQASCNHISKQGQAATGMFD